MGYLHTPGNFPELSREQWESLTPAGTSAPRATFSLPCGEAAVCFPCIPGPLAVLQAELESLLALPALYSVTSLSLSPSNDLYFPSQQVFLTLLAPWQSMEILQTAQPILTIVLIRQLWTTLGVSLTL